MKRTIHIFVEQPRSAPLRFRATIDAEGNIRTSAAGRDMATGESTVRLDAKLHSHIRQQVRDILALEKEDNPTSLEP